MHLLKILLTYSMELDRLTLGFGASQPPMHVGLIAGPLCPISNHGSPMALLKFQMAPKPIFLISSGSRKKEPRYICLSEPKASHSHNM